MHAGDSSGKREEYESRGKAEIVEDKDKLMRVSLLFCHHN